MESRIKKNKPLDKIILELETLVSQPGYLYVILFISSSDLFISPDKFADVNWSSRASYQEISYLFGLLIKKKVKTSIYPAKKDFSRMVNKTYDLLQQIHDHYTRVSFDNLISRHKKEVKQTHKPNIFSSPEAIIESIFYGDSGAYDFQYWESAPKRYRQDKEWISNNFGFSINDAVKVSMQIKNLVENKRIANHKVNTFNKFCTHLLESFSFDISEIKHLKVTPLVLDSFCITTPIKDESITKPSDFNLLSIKPLIKLNEHRYLITISFDLARSIDESPYYWINKKDKEYAVTASKNRGVFTETEVFELLTDVFGEDRVFKNIKLQRRRGEGRRSKGIDHTEIDVLVVLGNKALVVQAKSKKMTQLSRQGNLEKVASDFTSAIQEAYDQCIKSRSLLLSNKSEMVDTNGKTIDIGHPLNEAYLLLVTTDNYPALSMQLHSFLKKASDDPFPIAVNLFDLNLLSIYLPDPFDFMYYVNQRTSLSDKILVGTEIACLGYHLDQKLYSDKDDKYAKLMIDQGFGQLIDDDIMRRKYGSGISQSRIQQKWINPAFSKITKEIMKTDHPDSVDAIFSLYSLSGDTINELIKNISLLREKALQNNKSYNLCMTLDNGGGISYSITQRGRDLRGHVQMYSSTHKYKYGVDKWLGMGGYINDRRTIDCVTYSQTPWKKDWKLEQLSSVFTKRQKHITPIKLGRNHPCHCGSNKKYKKCCLPNENTG